VLLTWFVAIAVPPLKKVYVTPGTLEVQVSVAQESGKQTAVTELEIVGVANVP
jgi:propanediol dehydratase small subunit